MDDSLYDYLVSEILKGPYVKVTAWDLEKRTLVLTSVEIENQFNSFKSLFNLTFNLNVSESIQNEIQLRRQIVLVLRYLERKFNEIGFEYDLDEDREEIRIFNWAKYVKYDFNSLITDNSWDNLYRNTKPDSSGEYEIDDGHEFGIGYDVEAEKLVREQIKKIQYLFETFRKGKMDSLLGDSKVDDLSDPKPVEYASDPKIIKNQEEFNSMDKSWDSVYTNFEREKIDNNTNKNGIKKEENQIPKLSLNGNETISLLLKILKGYCSCKKGDLLNAINGKEIGKKIKFDHSQIQLADLFFRLKLNDKINEDKTSIKNWLCYYFEYKKNNNNMIEYIPLSSDYIYSILTSKKKISKKKRIKLDWLPPNF